MAKDESMVKVIEFLFQENANKFRQVGHKMMLKSENKEEKLALDVFADALKYLKNHALKNIKHSDGTYVFLM